MKNKFKTITAIVFFTILFQTAKAQVLDPTGIVENKKSYWQLSSRFGYDFPMFKEDLPTIDYKGGLMGGLSVNKYWNRWGIELDFDYINNKPFSTLSSPVPYLLAKVSQMELSTQVTNLSRMFVGIGPAYKWQSKNDKLTLELAAMGGLGFINGGEILVEGLKNVPAIPANVLMTYHSGFDNQVALTFKAQARATYWFKGGKWGVNGGVYYMNHFGVEESKKNQLLIDNGYIANNNTSGNYYYQMGLLTSEGLNNGEAVYNFQKFERRDYEVGTDFDEKQKIKLASVGVFAGLSYRFLPSKKVEEPIKVVEKIKEEPKIEKYCLQVTAKDKYTSEVLPNTDVAIKNSKGEVVSTAKTDAFGVVKFCDLLPDDYKIEGVLNEISLDGAEVKKSEFKNGETVKKVIIYSNRDFIVKGKAVECNTTTPIEGISVVLEKDDKSYKQVALTDSNGNFLVKLPVEGTYTLFGRKDGYFSQTETITASNYNRDKTLYVKIDICAEKADCGKGIGLKNILFDLNKYVIKEEAKVELNRLVRFMQDNPGVKIEVGSHTDCRSSAKYNQILSQNRANASVAYVVSQGIDKSRITGKGYGESKLLNECADGVKCAEELHSINRRTEMKVICPKL